MALSLTHQFGALSGKPISLDTGSTGNVSSDTTATFSAAAVWKSPPRASIRCRARRTSRGGSLTDIDIVSSPSSSSHPRSPHRSPSPVMSFRPDLALTCQAFATDERGMMMGDKNDEDESGVPVYVMMPLDTVTMMNTLNRKKAMSASLQALKSAGVTGVMVDVWWGLVERDHPGKYNWGGYVEFFDMAKMYGLKVQAVMSFHQCGGNVGDTVTIPLPNWALEEMDRDNDLAYTDQWGRRNFEYVSLGCDHLKVLKGRTPIECYADFMRAFRDNFKHLLGDTIVEIQVGMGPAGELRYPSYPEKDGIWRFPGIGAFQCFDKYMLQSLKSAAESVGKPEWGQSGPTDAGSYNNWPEDTTFFRRENGGWNTKYGEFFLKWYSSTLLNHGDLILTQANSIFNNVTISAKVAGIHWHYGTRSHAAELTAGYYNTRYTDGYRPIAKLLAKHGVVLNFTCVEMRDHEQPQDAQCLPEKLVRQVATGAKEAGVEFAGENALQRYDEYAHEQIIKAAAGEKDMILSAFTYLRMNPELFKEEHWRKFVGFVRKMKETGGNEKNKNNNKKKNKCKEEMERDADRFVHVTPQPFMQEAGVALMH